MYVLDVPKVLFLLAQYANLDVQLVLYLLLQLLVLNACVLQVYPYILNHVLLHVLTDLLKLTTNVEHAKILARLATQQ